MTVPIVIALAAVVLVLGLGAIIVMAMYSSVRGQTSSRARVTLVDTTSHALGAKLLAAAEVADGWAVKQGLEWAGLFEFAAPGNPPMYLAAWQVPDRNEYLAVFITVTPGDVVRARWLEFISLFDQDRSLSSSNTAGTMLFPRWPGQYKQAFTRLGFDELAARHREAVVFLRSREQVKDRADDRPLEDILLDAVRKSGDQVRGHRLWAVRGLWWWASQNGRANRSVAEQLARRDMRA